MDHHPIEIKVETEKPKNENDRTTPFLEDTNSQPKPEENTYIQKAMVQTFKSASNLANLLPTGSVLAFQLLSPIFTNQGECTSASRSITIVLISICAFSCFLLSFTDSLMDKNGKICYIFPTFNGLWVIDGSTTVPKEEASKYKLNFIDFLHAIMSVMVFGAVALFDKYAVSCFYPKPSDEFKKVLQALPVGIGVMCSMVFVTFPTKRHGIGFPVAAHA